MALSLGIKPEKLGLSRHVVSTKSVLEKLDILGSSTPALTR